MKGVVFNRGAEFEQDAIGEPGVVFNRGAEFEQDAIGEPKVSSTDWLGDSESENGVDARGGVDERLNKNFNDNLHRFYHKLLLKIIYLECLIYCTMDATFYVI